MRRLETTPAFTPAPRMSPLARIPAGLAGGVLLGAQLIIMFAGPLTLALLWGLLLGACAVGKRPIARVIFRAWPILLLAAATAYRRAGIAVHDDPVLLLSNASLIWLRFCWMVVAADLFISSFAWQSALAAVATGTTHEDGERYFARARKLIALTVWLAVVQLPLILGVLRTRRDAVRARGIRGARMLTTSLITGILPQLMHRADTYAEALIARGIHVGTEITTNARTPKSKHGIVCDHES